MSKPELIKRSGWAFVAGAFAFITLLSGSDPIAIPGSVVSAILLAVGMLGPVLWVIAIASMALVTIAQIEEGFWILIFVGPAISLLGLTLFGLTALRSKPMPRLNWLPVFAGIWYPVTYTLFSVYDISHKGVFPDQYLPTLVMMVVIQFLALCMLGIVLISDSSKELVTA
jgi:hypothetical protein